MCKKAVLFDLDGTLFPTHKVTIPAVTEALNELHIPPVADKQIKQRIGQTSESLASSLLPGSQMHVRQQFVKIVRRNERRLISQEASCFPGVRGMLDELLGLGYNLGICSNGSLEYIHQVLQSCGIDHCFTWISGAVPGSTKATRLRSLLAETGVQCAAFVGDRCEDIIAAQECKLPSIGVSYGYGGEEVELATFTAQTVKEITSYVMLSEVFHNILLHIDTLSCSTPRIIGVNGIDTSGKTRFALGLSSYLKSLGRKVTLIHIDDFHNHKEIRLRGQNEVVAYLDNAFNLDLLETELLRPAKQGLSIDKTLTLLDLKTETYSLERRFTIDSETIVIVEGVLLYRPPIDQHIDVRVFLDIPFEEVLHRASVRDVPMYGIDILERYRTKYLPAQEHYLKVYHPMDKSHLVIDNTDYTKPRIVRSVS